MKRNLVILCLLTGLICLCLYAQFVQSEQRELAERLVRLHVVANSDSAADQAVKLRVRDGILPVISRLTAGCQTGAEAAYCSFQIR